MSENFAEMLEESITQMNMCVGEIITGEVVDRSGTYEDLRIIERGEDPTISTDKELERYHS